MKVQGNVVFLAEKLQFALFLLVSGVHHCYELYSFLGRPFCLSDQSPTSYNNNNNNTYISIAPISPRYDALGALD